MGRINLASHLKDHLSLATFYRKQCHIFCIEYSHIRSNEFEYGQCHTRAIFIFCPRTVFPFSFRPFARVMIIWMKVKCNMLRWKIVQIQTPTHWSFVLHNMKSMTVSMEKLKIETKIISRFASGCLEQCHFWTIIMFAKWILAP